LKHHYRRWEDDGAVRMFANKGADDFFASERRFLADIHPDIDTVLDVGCASGRFIELLRSYRAQFGFTGIDLGANNVANAKRLYPDARFIEGNALDLDLDETFDLVNATGVMQHEPAFEALIERMIAWSRRYVLFDVKLGGVSEHLADLERAYSGSADHPLYFVVLAWPLFRAFLKSQPGIKSIAVYGYEAPPRFANLPDGIGPIIAAGVLIEKGDAGGNGPAFTIDLPSI